ncbi:MAG TPA: PD-(D/E)XK nuclease family protein [bacterium]|nr:PD-(D/E)XK nuclease family protein [bacterium]
MKKTLVTAPAGRGKTTLCIERYVERLAARQSGLDNDSYFILPTREHADRVIDLILSALHSAGLRKGRDACAGLFNPNVMTINDFVQMHAGASEDAVVTDILRTYCLEQICAGDIELGYYQDARRLAGFPGVLSDFIKEMKSSYVEFGDFAKAAARVSRRDHPALRSKLDDLCAIFARYQAISGGRRDAESSIFDFIRRSGDASLPGKRFGLIIFDGFYHFTGAQLQFIRHVAQRSDETLITLTMDEERKDDLFAYVDKTRRDLTGPGFDFAVVGASSLRSRKNMRPQGSDAISYIERFLFTGKTAAEIPAAAYPEDIRVRIFEATGPSGELEMIAREILRLTGDPGAIGKKEVRFTDFCVIYRSLSGVEDVIRPVFAKFGIPVEVHERRKLNNDPFVKAVVHLLRFFGADGTCDDLIEALKSAYFDFGARGGAELAGELRRRGVRTRDEACALCDDRDLAGEAREILSGLRRFDEAMRACGGFDAMKRCLSAFLSERQAQAVPVDGWDDPAFPVRREDLIARKEFSKIVDRIASYDAHGAPCPEHFYRLVLEGVEAALYSVGDANRNKVQVYDIATAIQKEYRAVFVAGLMEKEFPKQIIEDAVLRDGERRILNGLGAEAFEPRLDRVPGEKFLFYMALTRASRLLYLSYPKFTIDGDVSLPSFFVREVERLFRSGDLTAMTVRKDVTDIVPAAEEAVTIRDASAAVTFALSQKNPPAAAARASMRPDGYLTFVEGKALCVSLFDALSRMPCARYFPPELGAGDPYPLTVQSAAARGFYQAAAAGEFSSSSLSTFAVCPYKYFCRYALDIQEEEFGFDGRQVGKLMHSALERFYRKLDRRRIIDAYGDTPEGAETARRALIAEMEEAIREKGPEYFRGEKASEIRLAREYVAGRLALYIDKERRFERERAGLEPRFFERNFHICDRGVKLKGFIDRIDVRDDGSGLAALVIDYKSGSKTFDGKSVEDGVDLQLPIYVMAVRGGAAELSEIAGAKAMGGEIYNIKTFERGGMYAQEFAPFFGSKKGGLFEEYMEQARAHIARFVLDIACGLIRPNPYPGACGFCIYNGLCRYNATWQKKETWEHHRQAAAALLAPREKKR